MGGFAGQLVSGSLAGGGYVCNLEFSGLSAWLYSFSEAWGFSPDPAIGAPHGTSRQGQPGKRTVAARLTGRLYRAAQFSIGRRCDRFTVNIGFFLAAMIVVGTHYLPFITLYGMKMFGILAGLLVVIGAGLALYGPDDFSMGGWITAILLIAFAFSGRYTRFAGGKTQ
ncbi:MAG: hypothetical protein MZU91_06510 [Desulfosudis oleivorans]|nr:hypothetical protein [Desulfosudis oleivorans]